MAKKIKEGRIDANYTADMARCASYYLRTIPCPGGRPMVKGLICPHCDTDTSLGDCGGVIGFTKHRPQR